MRTLRAGAKGEEVKKLQTALNRAGSNLKADSYYGSKTERAVRNFQEDNGLTVDGVCGPVTWEALAPYLADYSAIADAVEECLKAVEELPEYKRLEALLYG